MQRRVTTDVEQETHLAPRGLPRRVIDITLGLFQASRANEFTVIDPTLAELIDRAPIALRTVLADHVGPRSDHSSHE